MPLDLPPATPPLAEAYVEAAQGMAAARVRLQVEGRLPPGLVTALARHNPDLAARLAADPSARSGAQRMAMLAQSDRTVLTEVYRQGWLAHPIHNQVGQGLDAATAAFWATGDQRDMTVLLDQDVLQQFTVFAPLPPTIDPVALRWFSVLHEAAHTQTNQLARPFALAAWSAEANAAMNRLVFTAPGLTEHPIGLRSVGVFRESFADAYGALMALRLTQMDPAMREALRYVAHSRQASTEARLRTVAKTGADLPASYVIFYDEHATTDTLGPLIADVEAGRLPGLDRASPAEVLALAQRYASQGLVAWLRGPEGVNAVNTFGWAHGVTSWQAIDNQVNAGPFVQAERLRALHFIGHRAQAFARADAEGHAPPAPVVLGGPNPVLDDLVARDAERFADFQRLPAAARATYAAQLAHPSPDAIVPTAIQAWADQETARADASTFRPAFRDGILQALTPVQIAAARQVADPAVREAAEVQRIADYVDARMAAYAAAERHGDVRPADAHDDPVLTVLAQQDALWQRQYAALPASERATLWRQRTEVTDSPDATPTPAYTRLVEAMRQHGQDALADPDRRRRLALQMESDFRAVSQALDQSVGAPALAQVPFPATAVKPGRRPGR